MEAPYVTIGQIASIGFFFYFANTPILGKLEARLIQNSNQKQVFPHFKEFTWCCKMKSYQFINRIITTIILGFEGD